MIFSNPAKINKKKQKIRKRKQVCSEQTARPRVRGLESVLREKSVWWEGFVKHVGFKLAVKE